MGTNKGKAGIFIIESFERKDERNSDVHEGQILQSILKLQDEDVPSLYFYIRTKTEFIELLKEFKESGLRYLHLSCHGDKENLFFTYESISLKDFILVITPYLDNRRLFLSACSFTTNKLANQVFNESTCYSIVGPLNKISYSKAAIIWASFYHLMFTKDKGKMKREDIIQQLEKVISIFEHPFNCFYFDKKTVHKKIS